MRDNEQLTTKTSELAKQWETWVEKNQDGYGNGVIIAVAAIGRALDEGRTPEEADSTTRRMGITGFMAGEAAKAVGHFHPRGDEYRLWWNKSWGVDEEKAKGGTVNPAILEINSQP